MTSFRHGLILALIFASTAQAQRSMQHGQWSAYGGDNGSTKYSALDQINGSNAADLEVAWVWDSPDDEITKTNPATGNANVWTIMSADEDLGYIYLPFRTPNGTPMTFMHEGKQYIVTATGGMTGPSHFVALSLP